MEQRNPNAKPRGMNSKKLLLFIVAGLLLLIICLLLIKSCAEDSQAAMKRESAAQYGILPGMDADEIQDRLNHTVDEGRLNVSIASVVTFTGPEYAGQVNIENISGNKYPFTVTIKNEATGDEYLKTDLIDPGYFVETMALSDPPPAGAYNCYAVFTAHDAETLEEVGKTQAAIVIFVRDSIADSLID